MLTTFKNRGVEKNTLAKRVKICVRCKIVNIREVCAKCVAPRL